MHAASLAGPAWRAGNAAHGGRAGPVRRRSHCLSPAACWPHDWAYTLTLFLNLSQIPVNRQVRDEARNAPPETRDDAVVAGLQARAVSRPAGWPAYPAISQAVYSSVQSVLSQGSDPRAALLDASTKIDNALR